MNSHHTLVPFAAADESTAGGGGAETRGALAETKDKLTQTARTAASQVKSAAADTVGHVKDRAADMAGEKKETAATRLSDYGSALHESARSLEEKDPNIAWFTHRAADRLQNAANYVRSRDFAGLRDDAERIARRHPAIFFGGMFLGGLLVGNLVKASRRKLDAADSDEDRSEAAVSEAGGDMAPAIPVEAETAPSTTIAPGTAT
jgi:gas vesicle protein